MNILVSSTEIYRCDEDDRYVIVWRDNGRVSGINYAQDASMTVPEFYSGWGTPDPQLFEFYLHVKSLARGRNLSEIELINEVIWVHFAYMNEIED